MSRASIGKIVRYYEVHHMAVVEKAAIIASVVGDHQAENGAHRVNLTVFEADGGTSAATNVPKLSKDSAGDRYWDWPILT